MHPLHFFVFLIPRPLFFFIFHHLSCRLSPCHLLCFFHIIILFLSILLSDSPLYIFTLILFTASIFIFHSPLLTVLIIDFCFKMALKRANILQHTISYYTFNNPDCAKLYNDDMFRIIGRARSSFHLAVLESIYIQTKKLPLCRQKEFFFSLGLQW